MKKTITFISVLLFSLFSCVQKGPAPFAHLDPTGLECQECHGENFIEVTSKRGHRFHIDGTVSESCTDCHPGNTIESHSEIDGVVLMKDGRSFQNSYSCDTCHGSGKDQVKAYWEEDQGRWFRVANNGYCGSCQLKPTTHPCRDHYRDNSQDTGLKQDQPYQEE